MESRSISHKVVKGIEGAKRNSKANLPESCLIRCIKREPIRDADHNRATRTTAQLLTEAAKLLKMKTVFNVVSLKGGRPILVPLGVI